MTMSATRSYVNVGVAVMLGGCLIAGAAEASVTTIQLGELKTAQTIVGTTPYTGNAIDFVFTVDAPLRYTFTATGDGPKFPFPITVASSGGGGGGPVSVEFGALPVTGTISYSLTSAVPELSTWAMMLLGFAGLGLVEVNLFKRAKPNLRA